MDFNSIYEKYQPLIYKYCYAHLFYNEESAHDACSDVFLAFSKKQHSIDESRIEAWLYSAAKKSILMVKRKYSRHHKNEVVLDEEHDISIDLFFDVSLSPDDIYNIKLEIMNKFDGDMKSLFKYRFIENKTLQEIQKITALPYTTMYLKVEEVKKAGIKILKEITDQMLY